MSDPPSRTFPFEVPIHDRMIARVAGKRPNTVLTVEQMVYTVRICEYTEPWSYDRHWCFESLGEALSALMDYLEIDVATEPAGWVKARDEKGTRRAHVEFGERVITIDGEDQ